MNRILPLALAVALAPAVQAAEPYGTASILPGYALSGGSYQAGISFELQDGWKTYWRAPGPVGIPPRFDWSGSSNLAGIEILWPQPDVTDEDGYFSATYHGTAVLPVRVTAANPKLPVELELAVEFGVCSDICIPASERLRATIAPDTAAEGEELIRAALARVPIAASQAGISRVECQMVPGTGGMGLEARMQFPSSAPQSALVAIEYPSDEIWIDLPRVAATGNTLSASAPLEYYGDGALLFDRTALMITVFDADRAIEIRGCTG